MNPRTTGLLAIVAAVFAAFLWFYEIEGEADRAALETEGLRVFAEVPSDGNSIRWMELKSSDGVEVRVERSDGRWKIVSPLEFRGDTVVLDAMASALAQLAGDGALASPGAADIYGLAEGARRIAFGAAGADEFGLLIGRAAPLGSSVYVARSGSEAVHVVPSWRVNAFDKSFEALRDARIHPFDREAVREIAANWPGGGVRLVRGETATGATPTADWRIVEPLEAAADADRIESLLTDLMHLRADGFVDVPLTAAEAGLDPPDFAVELELSGELAGPVRIAIGREVEGLRRVRGRDGVLYELAGERIDDFPLSVLEVRDRTLSRFVNSDAASFELVFAGEGVGGAEDYRVAVARDAGDATRWNSDPPLREGVATDIVANLANLAARDIQAEWLGESERAALGLLPPRVSLRVMGEGDPSSVLAEVWLGTLDAERGLVAMAAGRDEVFLLEARIAENLPTSREAFEASFVEPAQPGEPSEAVEEASAPLP